jgi:hypothetical protein
VHFFFFFFLSFLGGCGGFTFSLVDEVLSGGFDVPEAAAGSSRVGVTSRDGTGVGGRKFVGDSSRGCGVGGLVVIDVDLSSRVDLLEARDLADDTDIASSSASASVDFCGLDT